MIKTNYAAIKRPLLLVAASALLCFVGGCVGTTAPIQQDFYVLSTAHSDDSTQTPPISGTAIASISRVTLPRYLNQQNIVRRIDNEKIAVMTQQLWAEKLTQAIPAILAEHIALIKNRPIETHPLPPGVHISTRVEINIRQFIAYKNILTLRADYRIIRSNVMKSYQYTTRVQLADENTQSLVNGYSTGLQKLSTDIAKNL